MDDLRVDGCMAGRDGQTDRFVNVHRGDIALNIQPITEAVLKSKALR